MVTHFPHADGSITIRHQGYGPNFVQNLATHLAYLAYDLALDTCSLDLSLESLKRVEELITDRKKALLGLPEALLTATVAYCGEVLRTQLGGEWFYQVCTADEYGGERYFLALQSAAGKTVEFVGIVQKEFERPTSFHLYTYLFFLTLPEMPVQKVTSHPAGAMFPPWKERLPLKRIFPAKE